MGPLMGAIPAAAKTAGSHAGQIRLLGKLPKGTAGEQYADRLSSEGGAPPYRYTLAAGVLPQGLQLSESGELAGTPSEAGEFKLQITATDASDPAASGTRKYTLTIALALGPERLPPGEVGVPYGPGGAGVGIEAFGGLAPYTFVFFTPIPSAEQGLTLSETGLISGIPEEPGVLRLKVVASSSGREAVGRRSYVVKINGSRTALAPGPWLLEYSFSKELEPIFFDALTTEAGGELHDQHGASGSWSYHQGAVRFTLEVAPGEVNEYVGRGIAPVGPFTGFWDHGERAFRLIRE
ncbi:MAG TPA: Ig domain-containing protein [Solirubrobacteraceae bacterium]|nr:Ig domain-containing protein [Solirubrobacteraceae bacterium]